MFLINLKKLILKIAAKQAEALKMECELLGLVLLMMLWAVWAIRNVRRHRPTENLQRRLPPGHRWWRWWETSSNWAAGHPMSHLLGWPTNTGPSWPCGSGRWALWWSHRTKWLVKCSKIMMWHWLGGKYMKLWKGILGMKDPSLQPNMGPTGECCEGCAPLSFLSQAGSMLCKVRLKIGGKILKICCHSLLVFFFWL